MDMRFNVSDLQKKLMELGIDGIGLYLIDKGVDWLRMAGYSFIEKNLKQYSRGAILTLLGLADAFIPDIKRLPYIGDWLGLAGKYGVMELIKQAVDKPPYCIADDANTIHCYNFNSTNVKVAIDGNELTSGTDYTVSGTAEDFAINLSTALSSGEHEIRVADEKKAFWGKIKV